MSEAMRAVTITAKNEAEVREYPMPELGPDDVLVKMEACALCTMEQRMYTGVKDIGGFPIIGGHEGCGVVVKLGTNARGVEVGDKVVSTDPFCGTCKYCRSGNESQCDHGIGDAVYKRADGVWNMVGFLATYVAINYRRLVKIDPATPPEKACLAEPVGCVLHSVRKVDIDFGDTVVVIGAGIMGLLHVQLAKMRGALVIVSEMDEERHDKALAAGADFVVNPAKVDLKEFVQSKSDGLGADVVFNTTPVAAVWKQALDILAPMGKLVCYSSQHPDEPIGVSMGWVHSTEVQIIGTQSAGEADMATAARLISCGLIDVDLVTDHIVDFEDGAQAFADSVIPGTYRVIVRM